tara:strand:- start:7261 stop:7506 length:246 start_codon:yes stop_codon:yes gene_type:complete
MKYIISLVLLGLILTSYGLDNSSKETQKFVYTCSNPNLKCYYKFPCSDFFRDCNQNKGKVMKVTLERAKALGKEECSCSNE